MYVVFLNSEGEVAHRVSSAGIWDAKDFPTLRATVKYPMDTQPVTLAQWQIVDYDGRVIVGPHSMGPDTKVPYGVTIMAWNQAEIHLTIFIGNAEELMTTPTIRY